MKERKITINYIKHVLTGAEVPIIVRKWSKDKEIEEYSEWTEKRKGFTVKMLEERWNKSHYEVIKIITTFKVPAFVRYKDIESLREDQCPVYAAFFFEEYIYGIENKSKLSHNKLKSRLIGNETEH